MTKVIIIGAIPNMVNVSAILRNTMTAMSNKAEIIINSKADSSKDFSDTLATIMEILGLGELPDIKLIEDMKSIEREFKPKEESISKLKENAEKIKILKEQGPWYNRFYKPSKHLRINDKYKSFKPQTKKKGTRKKGFLVCFLKEKPRIKHLGVKWLITLNFLGGGSIVDGGPSISDPESPTLQTSKLKTRITEILSSARQSQGSIPRHNARMEITTIEPTIRAKWFCIII